MSVRQCPVCCERIVRNNPALTSCKACERYFHSACLSSSDPLQHCNKCIANRAAASYGMIPLSTNDSTAPPRATSPQPSLPAPGEPAQSATPTAGQHTAKRRASTPSPSVVPVSKAHCSSLAADTVLFSLPIRCCPHCQPQRKWINQSLTLQLP